MLSSEFTNAPRGEVGQWARCGHMLKFLVSVLLKQKRRTIQSKPSASRDAIRKGAIFSRQKRGSNAAGRRIGQVGIYALGQMFASEYHCRPLQLATCDAPES